MSDENLAAALKEVSDLLANDPDSRLFGVKRSTLELIAALPAVTVGAYTCTGVMDKDGREICVGDRILIDLTSNATKREYWRPEYEVVFNPPCFTLKHVGGDKDSNTARFQWNVPQRSSTERIRTLRVAALEPVAVPDPAAIREAALWDLLEEIDAQIDLAEEISPEFADKVQAALWADQTKGTADDRADLKPCPFCGGDAEINIGIVGGAWISCKSCPAETDDASLPSIIAAWNTRTTHLAEALAMPEVAALVEALRLIADDDGLGTWQGNYASLVLRFIGEGKA